MKLAIAITAFSSISALGSNKEQIWENYLHADHAISLSTFNQLVCQLSSQDKARIKILKNANKKYKNLDDSVLYGLYVARMAYQQSGWHKDDVFGINMGSSRGATTLFEKYHADFLTGNKLSPLSSPSTTLGNISSWLAHDLQSESSNIGPNISHSVTCSSALHAILNAVAWLQSGLCDKFMVGGSEAPLTEFTVAQMQALGIYANNSVDNYPCKALDLNKHSNGMVLGEAAAIACLSINKEHNNALALIVGMGYATEILQHNTSISSNAECMQQAMSMALKNHDLNDVDIIISHTPGTIQGDQAEINAIKAVFSEQLPAITTNK
ncbi:MAG: hypothetical protein JKY19_06040, partial [Alcanivoracaceae bacterium]|nr:hypothetical protein [Alcanivoracaceae bacterium]